MYRLFRILLLVALGATFAACASSGSGSAEGAGETRYPAGYTAPPAGSELTKVQVGMNDTDVRHILGDPDNSNAYTTGKAWIPFYYGPDTSRSDWMYKGQGRVVFSRNRYSGAMKVIRVMYNPNES
jgi:outer membrane protein assembly factor BamE (lipoprotein component of BamABCDE complex)